MTNDELQDEIARCEQELDEDEHISLQPIGTGDLRALVVYSGDLHGVLILGAYIGGEFIEAEDFSGKKLERWSESILSELQRDADDAAATRYEDRQLAAAGW